MVYTLGLDLGTTSTAAAVNNGESVSVFAHADGSSAVPSVVALAEDGSFLVGEPAIRHASLEPGAVAREFKRRFGDTTPLLLRGTPVAANELTLQLAKTVTETVTAQIGQSPERLVVCHPANWGQYKTGLLSDTLNSSTLPPHELLSEPQAAAIHYSSQERIDVGATVAVYDIGGSTFDIAVLRKTTDGWELLGRPGGVERLGGIDFDTALFHHVLRTAEVDLDRWDAEDPAVQLAVGRLREACNGAKHLLSTETEASVALDLPDVDGSVRVTRDEFEALIAPLIGRTIEAFDVTVASADIILPDLDRVLLVGGSSRIPLISQRVASHTARPLAVDAHPKHATALGAARATSPVGVPEPQGPPRNASPGPLASNFPDLPHISDEPMPEFMTRRSLAPADTTNAESHASADSERTMAVPSPLPPVPTPDSTPATPEPPEPLGPMPTPLPAPPLGDDSMAARQPPTQPLSPVTQSLPESAEAPAGFGPGQADGQSPREGRSSRLPLLLTLGVVVLGLVAAGVFWSQRDPDRVASTTTATTASAGQSTPTSTTPAATVGSTTPSTADIGTASLCEPEQFPRDGVNYRVSFIPEDDVDGGLNARSTPRAADKSNVVTVFSSLSPVKVTRVDCAVDTRGNAWWGVHWNNDVLWVAARLLEEI